MAIQTPTETTRRHGTGRFVHIALRRAAGLFASLAQPHRITNYPLVN